MRYLYSLSLWDGLKEMAQCSNIDYRLEYKTELIFILDFYKQEFKIHLDYFTFGIYAEKKEANCI